MPRSVSSSIAATRVWSRPARLASRGLSWFPSTQFGQPNGGRAASYFSTAVAIVRAFQGIVTSWKLNGMCTPLPPVP